MTKKFSQLRLKQLLRQEQLGQLLVNTQIDFLLNAVGSLRSLRLKTANLKEGVGSSLACPTCYRQYHSPPQKKKTKSVLQFSLIKHVPYNGSQIGMSA